jgi:hypothetical protein
MKLTPPIANKYPDIHRSSLCEKYLYLFNNDICPKRVRSSR